MRVLVAGESWTSQTSLITGVDTFTFASYTEEVGPFRDVLSSAGHQIAYLPSHLVPRDFPEDVSSLQGYDVVVLSDIGANSLLLSPAVYERSERRPNRLEVLASWVEGGGSLLMVGGYLSFSGLEGKAHFGDTSVERILPVTCVQGDDRVEAPEGVVPTGSGARASCASESVIVMACSPRMEHHAASAGCRSVDKHKERSFACAAGCRRRPKRRVYIRLRPSLGDPGILGVAQLRSVMGQPNKVAWNA
jgi:uncharacterized membrane protein